MTDDKKQHEVSRRRLLTGPARPAPGWQWLRPGE